MSGAAMSLKAKIRNYAKNNHIAAQVVLQNYMFERFLERLSKSDYRDKFVMKGGLLVAAIVGLDTRSTMDLDATLRDLPLKEEKIYEVVQAVGQIDLGDEVSFEMVSVAPIRKDDQYGGYCVRVNAIYDTITTPLSIDISTGDIITPSAIQYEFNGIFDEDLRIRLWGYNIETIMAEKVETILSRGIFNTRPRDYYDVYILGTTQTYNIDTYREALAATSKHRGTSESIADKSVILERIAGDSNLQKMWRKYQQRFSYASQISYEDIMNVLMKLVGV